MKRSEMLAHLKGYIRGIHIDDFKDFHNGNLSTGRLINKICKTFLEQVEVKGMLPPFVPNEARDEGHVMYCEWEPEE